MPSRGWRDWDWYARAYELRLKGLTFKTIGERLGITRERACQMYHFYARHAH